MLEIGSFSAGQKLLKIRPVWPYFGLEKGGISLFLREVFFGVQVFLPLGGPFLSDRALPVSGVCQTVLAASAIVIW